MSATAGGGFNRSQSREISYFRFLLTDEVYHAIGEGSRIGTCRPALTFIPRGAAPSLRRIHRRAQPSSTSRTFAARVASEKGLAMKLTPSSSTPRCAITFAV